MKLNKILILLPSVISLGLTEGCKNGAEQPWNTPTIELSATSVTSDKTTGNVSVIVTFRDFANVKCLDVTKVDEAGITTEQIPKSDLTERYEYVYTVIDSDSDQFTLEFQAVGTDGSKSPAKTLQVVKLLGSITISIDSSVVKLPYSPDPSEISVVVNIDGFEQLDHIAVGKNDWGKTVSNKIYASELSPQYTFSYTVTENDSDLFTFDFAAFDKDGIRSSVETLTVDRRSRLGFRNLKVVSRVTGAENDRAPMPTPAYTLNNNTHQRYNVGGTDLGIVWEMDPGHYGLFFGDTFGSDFRPNFDAPGPNGGSWRSNVLLFSDDGDLSDGMTVDGAAVDANGRAREICLSAKDTSGNGEYTTIPTGAIRANGNDYVHYMSIKNWNGWVTNFSSYYKSDDDGKTWTRCNTNFGGESNFGQVGLFKKDGYVYLVGTKTGRDDKPHLARFLEKDIEQTSQYEFWDGDLKEWVRGKENAATVLIDDIAGELSIAYNRKFGKWIILYFSGPRYEITYREANDITGPWSAPRSIASGGSYPQLYGSYIHPLSLDGNKLYFVMSMWLPYNTYLMSVDLIRE